MSLWPASSTANFAEKHAWCHLQIELPGVQLKSATPELIRGKVQAGTASYQILAICQPNQSYTTLLPDLKQFYKEEQSAIYQYSEFIIEDTIPAAIYLRSRFRQGRRLNTVEMYLATRNVIYRISLIPEANAGISDMDPALRYLHSVAKSMAIALPDEPALSESSYKWRLRIVAGLLALVFLVGLWIILRNVRRRKQVSQTVVKE